MKFKALLLSILLLASPANAGVLFDGTNDCLSSASTIAFGTNIVTVSFWMYWDSFANDDDLAMELSANYNTNFPGLLIDPNASAPVSGRFNAGISATGPTYRTESITRPSAAVWHHYSIVFDNSTAAGDIKFYVDGVSTSTTVDANSKTTTGNIRTDTLYFMSRACTSLYADGRLDEVYIHSGELSADEISLLYNSRMRKIGQQIDNTLISYWPLDECPDGTACATASMFRDNYDTDPDHLSPSNSPTGRAGEILSYAP